MADVNTIVVGGRELLTPLQTRPDVTAGSVQVFPTDDIRAALETILSTRPGFLILDHEFRHSTRGTAMIDRLHADPGFDATEVLVVNGATIAPLALAAESAVADPVDWRGTRRVQRIRIESGIEVQVDGAPALLVDLSTMGAQVVSGSALKPNQRVRFSLTAESSGRMVATVAWANFELPKGRPLPQYRAGLEFTNPDAQALEEFCRTKAAIESIIRR